MFFEYEWKLRSLPSSKDKAHVYIHKKQNNCETFLYTKSKTIFKKLDNSRYVLYSKIHTIDVTGFLWNFWSWNLYTKITTLCVTWRFYIQKARHFAKSKTICDTFLYTKSGTFALCNFSLNFWNLWRGGAFIHLKKCTLRENFILKKRCTLRYVTIFKEPDTRKRST